MTDDVSVGHFGSYQLYRKSTIGLALQDTLDECVHDGTIPSALAMKIYRQFDKSVAEQLRKTSTKISFKV